MRLKKRIKNLEKDIIQKKEVPGIAVKFLDGYIGWADQIFPNEEEFLKAVEKTFKDEPPSPGNDLILINFLREMKNINAGKYSETGLKL